MRHGVTVRPRRLTVSARSCTITPCANLPRYRGLHQEFSAYLTIGATESATVRTDRLSQGQRQAPCTTSGRTDSADIATDESQFTLRHYANGRLRACAW